MSDEKSEAAPQEAASKQDSVQPYRVLARKYRPQTFDDLIGQEAMVRTLTNAFTTGRIAQAYMLTGVRGVGKTTTARLIARALNYELDGGAQAPTIEMPELGTHCAEIMESRHVDVIEMDAASNTGIDDIREIIESARYRPVSARYKVYIIDEVHMLSKAAFNGLLKTLEEPPPHVKFLFATTEIRKVPVTVLSRCQRFDLRRIDEHVLVEHLRGIASKEGVSPDDTALAVIARAGEGSVRDALSLLDQAIALGGASFNAEQVRDMLGLVDRSRTIELLDHILRGETATALSEFKDQYDAGADALQVLSDLAQLVHWITRLKLVETAANDPSVSEVERTRGAEMAEKLTMRALTRAWQMLIKGIGEVQTAQSPMAAAEMLIVRLCYVSDLPAPEDLVRSLSAETASTPQNGASQSAGTSSQTTGQGAPQAVSVAPSPSTGGTQAMAQPQTEVASLPQEQQVVAVPDRPMPETFAEVVALAGSHRDIRLKTALERSVRPVLFERGHIEISLEQGTNARIANELATKLKEWTGERWVVSLSSSVGEKTLHEEATERRVILFEEARKDPVVDAALKAFPGAEIVDVRDTFDTSETPPLLDGDLEEDID